MIRTKTDKPGSGALGEMGGFLRERRKAQGLTQEGLASVLGVTKQVVSDYETGRRRIPVTRLSKITKVLKLENSQEFSLRALKASAVGLPGLAMPMFEDAGDPAANPTGVVAPTGDIDVDEILWLKRCHDTFQRDEKGTFTPAYSSLLESVKNKLRVLTDTEVQRIEARAQRFRLIVPDLYYELQRDPYTKAIKAAFERDAKFEYLLPATGLTLNQFRTYTTREFPDQWRRRRDQIQFRFIPPGDWIRLIGEGSDIDSGYYSGRCLYTLDSEDEPVIGVEYDRKRSEKNYLMTPGEIAGFEGRFNDAWSSRRVITETQHLERYLALRENLDNAFFD